MRATNRVLVTRKFLRVTFPRAVGFIVFMVCSVAARTRGQSNGMKDFGNRLEGTTIRKDALEDFTLVSIEGPVEPFATNANLNVRFYLPHSSDGGQRAVFVEAVELEDSFHYFMQAKGVHWKEGDWNVFKPWPTSSVIDRLGIRPDNLGVRAGYQIPGKPKVYVPATVRATDNDIPTRLYTFHFVTGRDLQSIDISVRNSAGNAINIHTPNLTCNRQLRVNCILFAAGTTQSFDLNMSSVPEGEYDIGLIGHIPRTSDTTSLDIFVYHHP
jgi:hypothetical protein